MEKTTIAGVDLAYEEHGQGAPLVLIHGYPLDHTIWKKVVPLLENDFHIIAPDLRGFGQSEGTKTNPSILTYASDIEGLLIHLKIKRVFLAGHSMGGYVAFAFAREYPEAVSGLALVSSQATADSPEQKEGRLATAKQVLEKGVKIVADSMSPKLSADKGVQSYVHELISKQKPSGISNALTAMAERPDSTELLSAFHFPCVIIHGAADELIPIERGRKMIAALPTAHFVEIPNTGHMPMMEKPEVVADALRLLIK